MGKILLSLLVLGCTLSACGHRPTTGIYLMAEEESSWVPTNMTDINASPLR